MSIKFLYFDLGNVLLFFSHRLAASNLAQLAGVADDDVFAAAFRSDINLQCDSGQLSGPEFCRWFRKEFSCEASDVAIALAFSDIFQVNVPMKTITSHLRAAGYRLGILSNTCDTHYDYFASGRYSMIPEAFEVVVLSYRLKLMKPDAAIYLEAARLAGVAPEEVFYTDDILANVEGARTAGFDAVLYTSPTEYVAELRKRGVRFNY